jgi:NitT/TauT family transport system ATP-binding protein
MRTVVSLKNVSKSYDGHTVVDDVSLAVAAGEIVALLGQTGAGKSTILNMVMGQTAPSAGEVRVNEADPCQAEALRGFVAVSFQTDRLLPWRSAKRNVTLGMEYLGIPKQQRFQRARDWLNRVKLSDIHHSKYPHQLSGGMRQRVSLARAMSIDPELILLDESFSQLDHTTSKVLREDFVALIRQFRKTCMLITHRIEDAIEMADRIIVLAAPARIKAELSIDQTHRDPQSLARTREQIAGILSESQQAETDAI